MLLKKQKLTSNEIARKAYQNIVTEKHDEIRRKINAHAINPMGSCDHLDAINPGTVI